MAHTEQLRFVGGVKAAFPVFFTSARVLEIGSLDINGTTRQFFGGGKYTGLDIAPGPGVDVVSQGQNYDAPADSFDTVISCEAMEHNPYWKETLINMVRLCRPGGLVLMTCASSCRTEHGTRRTDPASSPLTVGLGWDYYRNLTERDLSQAIPLRAQLAPLAFFTNWAARDLYMIGFKLGAPAPADAIEQIAAMRRQYRAANVRHGFQSHYLVLRTLLGILGEARLSALRFGPS